MNRLNTPSWFRLANYSAQESLDLPGWLLQFGLRRDLRAFLNSAPNTRSASAGLAAELLDWIHADPIVTKARLHQHFGSPLLRVLLPSVAVLFEDQPRNRMGVHATTVDELFRFGFDVHPELHRHAKAFFDLAADGITSERDSKDFYEELDNRLLLLREAPDLLDEPKSKSGEAYLPRFGHPVYCSALAIQKNLLFTIDAALPDNLLIAQFKNALRRARTYVEEANTFPERLPSDSPAKWISRQLLAYIDLTGLHPEGCANPLTRAELTELIWPADHAGTAQDRGWGEQEVKDTVDSLATEMLAHHSESFWVLQATVAGMLAEESLDLTSPPSLKSSLERPQTRRNRGKKNRR